ncbi:MAG: DUF3343 domain-containing protein [Bacillota bacterium]
MSVHQAIKAERLLLAAGVKVKFRPTPRELSVSCGQSMVFAAVDQEQIIKQFTANSVVWNNLFELSGEEGAKQYERIGNYQDYQLE